MTVGETKMAIPSTLKTMLQMVLAPLEDGVHDLFYPPKTNVAALDVLRSAAILLVFTGHFVLMFTASSALIRFPVFRWGWTGVDLFFVLSGFLIGAQLWKELARTGRIRIGRFLLRRGLRIWPLYFAVVAYFAAGYFFGRNISHIWSDVFFLSNFIPGDVLGGWSLSTEEQFYILTPILLSLLAFKVKLRWMWMVPCLGIAALIANRAWSIARSGLSASAAHDGGYLYHPITTHADALAVGVLLGWLSVFHKGWLQSRPAVAVSAGVMFASGLVLYRVSPALLNFTALGLIYGAMELYAISTLPFPRVLHWRGFYLVSRLSFGLYLNHLVVFSFLLPVLLDWSELGVSHLLVIYVLCLVVALLVAMVTFLLIEWPFLRIRARWMERAKVREGR